MKIRTFVRGTLIFILALLPALALFYLGDTSAILDTLSRYDALALLALTSLSLVMYLLRYLRWSLICEHNALTIPHRTNINIYLAGLALAFTPARSGELFRAYLIPDHGSRLRFAFHSFFMEKAGDLLSVGLFCLIAYSFISTEIEKRLMQSMPVTNFHLVATILPVLLIILLLATRYYRNVINKLAGIISSVTNLTAVYSLKIFSISLSIWSLQLFIIIYIVKISLLTLSMADSVFIYSFSLIIGTASMIPGGLGSFDITYMMLMNAFDQNKEAALISLIAVRFFGLWLGVLIGIPAWYRNTIQGLKSGNAVKHNQ